MNTFIGFSLFVAFGFTNPTLGREVWPDRPSGVVVEEVGPGSWASTVLRTRARRCRLSFKGHGLTAHVFVHSPPDRGSVRTAHFFSRRWIARLRMRWAGRGELSHASGRMPSRLSLKKRLPGAFSTKPPLSMRTSSSWAGEDTGQLADC